MERKRYEEFDDYYEEDSIDLVDLLFMIIRRWKVIVLVTIPIVMAGFFYASTRPSVYRADTTLMVSSGMQSTSIDRSDIDLSQKLVVTYSEIAKSRDILRRVITKYDLPEGVQQLAGAINISIVKNTELIKLSYTCGDPKLAEAVTNEVANEFIQKVSQVMRVRNVAVVERAQEPAGPLPKGRAKILLASIILGVGLGVVFAFLIEALHKKLRKSSDIEKILGVEMLGMIPEIDMEEGSEEKDA